MEPLSCVWSADLPGSKRVSVETGRADGGLLVLRECVRERVFIVQDVLWHSLHGGAQHARHRLRPPPGSACHLGNHLL